MFTLKEFLEVIEYRITEGSKFCWDCFGTDAYQLDFWNGRHEDGHSLCVIFDNKTQVVYMVEACDYKNDRAYRLVNPKYKDAYDAEVKHRGIDDQAWEDEAGNPIEWCNLETEKDWFEKACAIVAGKTYDTRIQIPVDFSDEELLQYMKLAHDQDMTFNKFVEMVLRQAINNQYSTSK
jgi:hypothetical protein